MALHAYGYDPVRPHQAITIGDRRLTYDANGNTERECAGDAGCGANANQLRRYYWTEENRLAAVIDGGGANATRFVYDAAGERIAKLGRAGESLTIGQFFALKGRKAAAKHVFAGPTRIATKLSAPSGWLPPTPTVVAAADGEPSTGAAIPGCAPSDYKPSKCPAYPGGDSEIVGPPDATVKPMTYYYHPDHLGSTSWVTDQNGRVHEHVEYFPYGQVWRDVRADADAQEPKAQRFLFTGKELDEETGLYYFGARYLDPIRARWKSVDPLALTDPARLLIVNGQANPYGYGAGRPTHLVDPDGREVAVRGTNENKSNFLEQVYASTGVKYSLDRNGRMRATNSRNPKVGSPAAADVVRAAVDAPEVSHYELVNRDPRVLFDSYKTGAFDVGDFESVGKSTPLLRASLLAHVFAERTSMYRQLAAHKGGLDWDAAFRSAHISALPVDALVIGPGLTTRQEIFSSDHRSLTFLYFNQTGDIEQSYTVQLDKADRTPR